MFLKSMEIFGFKSFAERTELPISTGITIVVGPNGCGKSNIVDSAKWVLGEKQAKNIRGEKMEDVIFMGTEQRKPLSLAEVSLTIDNSTRILSFDSDTVTVTRRVFRDGESEYLINKSPVRLKDIEQLFMDTGIGKTSYSVMEQGRIDMILSTKAEDRRYIFEEAAGISRYKMQKKESLKKLQDTGENLERINDIIHEIEREKDVKARQAEKTRIYLTHKADLKKADVRLSVLKFRDLDKKRVRVEEQLKKVHDERNEVAKRLEDVSEENEKDEQLKNEIQLELFELDKKLHTYRIKVEDIDNKKEKNQKLIFEHNERQKRLLVDVAERRTVEASLVLEKEKNEESGRDIARRIEQDQLRLKNFFENRKRKIETIHQNREKIEDNKNAIIEKENELVALREELEIVIRQLIDAIEKRKAELQDSEHERQNAREAIHLRLNGFKNTLDNAVQSLLSQNNNDALEILKGIDFDLLSDDISRFESFEDGFRSILFDKTGIHARKEDIDSRIRIKISGIDNLRRDNTELEQSIIENQQELEQINDMITMVEKDLSKNDNEKSWLEKNMQDLVRQIDDVKKQIRSYDEEIERSQKNVQELQKEIKEWEDRLVEFNERSQSLQGRISSISERKTGIDQKIQYRKESTHKDNQLLQKLNDRISEFEKNKVELDFKLQQIEEYLWTEYEKKLDDIRNVKVDELELNNINTEITVLKKKISDLGPINNLAIEEFNDLKKRFEYYSNQRKDIEKARQDILSVIEDINRTSVEMFIETFKQIQKNFSEIFQQLFEGGNAEVTLLDTENVLESGIDVMVRPPGKKPKSISLLSGGERSLTAIALLFATYMVKPSPFCFLDEIDAALDEENVGRFLRLLKRFSQKTQFIMVTHNKKSMSIGSSLYGVTMEEPGVSRLVSVKLDRQV